MYPIVVGREVVGTVIRAGSKLSEFKAGDVVGRGKCLELWGVQGL